MTVDEVAVVRSDIMRELPRRGRTQVFALIALYEEVLDEIAGMKAQHLGDADQMRALARAAIGADDETS